MPTPSVLIVAFQWIAEVNHFCGDLPILLIGCKIDLRQDPRVVGEMRLHGQRPITYEEVRPSEITVHHP